MAIRHIDSPANPLVKEIAGLKERRHRQKSARFLIEGQREVERAILAGAPIDLLMLAPSLLKGEQEESAWRDEAGRLGVELVLLSEAAFSRISMREGPDGIAARAVTSRLLPEQLSLGAKDLVLVLAGLDKPGNVGALLRSADATGVAAVMLCSDFDADDQPAQGLDLGNPNLIRSSMGSCFSLPIAVGSREEVLAALTAAQLELVAATPSASLDMWDADLAGGRAILLGRENEGLSAWWLRAATMSVRIPMRAQAADSLNVSVAGAVLLYEALRQRSTSATALSQ